MSDSHLNVDVRDDLIVVTEEGLYAIYSKPEGGQPWIMARRVPEGQHEFKARAWGAACAKAPKEVGLEIRFFEITKSGSIVVHVGTTSENDNDNEPPKQEIIL